MSALFTRLIKDAHLKLKVLQNLPQEEWVAPLGAIQESLDPVLTEAVTNCRKRMGHVAELLNLMLKKQKQHFLGLPGNLFLLLLRYTFGFRTKQKTYSIFLAMKIIKHVIALITFTNHMSTSNETSKMLHKNMFRISRNFG